MNAVEIDKLREESMGEMYEQCQNIVSQECSERRNNEIDCELFLKLRDIQGYQLHTFEHFVNLNTGSSKVVIVFSDGTTVCVESSYAKISNDMSNSEFGIITNFGDSNSNDFKALSIEG